MISYIKITQKMMLTVMVDASRIPLLSGSGPHSEMREIQFLSFGSSDRQDAGVVSLVRKRPSQTRT